MKREFPEEEKGNHAFRKKRGVERISLNREDLKNLLACREGS